VVVFADARPGGGGLDVPPVGLEAFDEAFVGLGVEE